MPAVEIYNRFIVFHGKENQVKTDPGWPSGDVIIKRGRGRPPKTPRPSPVVTSSAIYTDIKPEIKPFASHHSVQVKIEIGHKAALRKKKTTDGFTHDWSIFVRGPEGSNIQHFVDKCVFHLHDSFPKPKRVVKEPPYQVTESGYGSFNLPVEIYFKTKDEPRKIRFDYDLFLHLQDSPPVNHIRCEKLTFQNPTEEFRRKLIKAGGVGILTQTDGGPGLSSQTSPNRTTAHTTDSKAFADLFGAPTPTDTVPGRHGNTESSRHGNTDGSGKHHGEGGGSAHKKHKSHKDKDRDRDKSKSSSKSSSAPKEPGVPASGSSHSTSPPDRPKDKSGVKRTSEDRQLSGDSHAKKKKKDKDKERSKNHSGTSSTKDDAHEKHRSSKSSGDVSKSSASSSHSKERSKDKHHHHHHHHHKDKDTGSSGASKSKSHKKSHKEKHRSHDKSGEKSKSSVKSASSPAKSPASKSKDGERPQTGQKKPAMSAPKLPPLEFSTGETSDVDPFDDPSPAASPPLQKSAPSAHTAMIKSLFASEDEDGSEDEDMEIEVVSTPPKVNPPTFRVHHPVQAVPPTPRSVPPVSSSPKYSKQQSPHKTPENTSDSKPHKITTPSPPSSALSPLTSQRSRPDKSSRSSSSKSRTKTDSKPSKKPEPPVYKEPEPPVYKEPEPLPEPRPRSETPVWAVSPQSAARRPEPTRDVWSSLAKPKKMSPPSPPPPPPRLAMDPPDLLKSTQHSDFGFQRASDGEKENQGDKYGAPAAATGKAAAAAAPPLLENGLTETQLAPGRAPNGETFDLLRALQEALNTTKDESVLAEVVHILEESGEVFSITDSSLDFDLCYVNSDTVHRLKHCLQPTLN